MKTLGAIKGVGKATLEHLEALGIATPEELLFFVPSKYIDPKTPTPVLEAETGQLCLFEGEAVSATEPSRRGTKSFTVTLKDTLDPRRTTFRAVFFNQPYYRRVFSEGTVYRFLGRLAGGEALLTNPVFEAANNVRTLNGIIPVYPLKGTIGRTAFSKIVKSVLEEMRAESVGNMLTLAEDLRKIHFPNTLEEAEQGMRALACYDVATAIKIYKNTVNRGDTQRKVFYKIDNSIILDFENSLSVTPTDTQRKTFYEIFDDLASDKNMSRIVSGDVGSGKTLTAFFAAFCAARAGHQCAVMAPTEILADQHARKFAPIAEKTGIRAALLTSSTAADKAKKILQGVANGEISVIFGTQSLLSERVRYRDLTLAVIDEQHRFGVNERAELQNRGAQDVLTLTATPIPRSLALAFYDDIDVSHIERRAEAAPNIRTRIVTDTKIDDMLNYVADECKKGVQAFIVCPAIRDSEGFETLSVESFVKEHAARFNGVEYRVLHGRMSGEEKERVMNDFSKGKIKLLIATSVIEVGVDTSARIMCVLSADRFGLASLHQLRGRVGRDGAEAYCFLHVHNCSEKAIARLRILTEFADGTQIAEHDFEMRGAGDLLGTRQSGSTSTPALGLPLTPDVLRAARGLPDDLKEFVTSYFAEKFAPKVYEAFAEKVIRVTLDS